MNSRNPTRRGLPASAGHSPTQRQMHAGHGAGTVGHGRFHALGRPDHGALGTARCRRGREGKAGRTGQSEPRWDPVAGQSDSCDVCRLGEFQSKNKVRALCHGTESDSMDGQRLTVPYLAAGDLAVVG